VPIASLLFTACILSLQFVTFWFLLRCPLGAQVGEAVHQYLDGEGLADTVAVKYIDSAASPTSMNGDRLNIRVPCLYRAWRTEGTLAHEIGTHYTRRTNDALQPVSASKGLRERCETSSYECARPWHLQQLALAMEHTHF
jgi:hypothetical protein